MSCGSNRGCDTIAASACRIASCALATANQNVINIRNLQNQINNLDLLLETASGGYDPTLTQVQGLAANPVFVQQFLFSRTGNIVEVTGSIGATSDGSSATLSFRVSPPIASDFTATDQANGTNTFFTGVIASLVVSVATTTDPATDEIVVTVTLSAAAAGAFSMNLSFLYQILP